MNQYGKVEGMLYGHYRKKNRISSLRSREIRIQNRIDNLRRDLKECNIDLGDTMKAIDYSRDPIQSGSVTSNIERELERAVDRVLSEIEHNIKDKYKTKSKINYMIKQIDDIEILLEELTGEELEIIGLTYADKLSEREVADRLFLARSTLRRKKENIISVLIGKMNQK